MRSQDRAFAQKLRGKNEKRMRHMHTTEEPDICILQLLQPLYIQNYKQNVTPLLNQGALKVCKPLPWLTTHAMRQYHLLRLSAVCQKSFSINFI